MIIKCIEGKLFDNQARPIPVAGWEDASVRVLYPEGIIVSVQAPEEVNSGEEFTVRLAINQVKNFDAFQVDLVYAPAIFEALHVKPGLIGDVQVPIAMWGFIPPEVPGVARILGNVAGVPGVTGSGYLAEIILRAK